MQTLDGIITQNLVYTATSRPSEMEKLAITSFLYESLDGLENSKENIRKAMDYSIKEFHSFGGFTIVYKVDGKIVGAAILNHTGMQGYIAENILVYLAVHRDFRGNGIAGRLINQVKAHAKGDITLHLKQDASLNKMYEKFGFSNSIVEMRLNR